MLQLKSRIKKMENDFFGGDAGKYRELCFCFNLTRISDEDLCEVALSRLEGRPCDPETERRIYARIPPDAPRHLIDQARTMATEFAEAELAEIDIKTVFQEMIDYRDKCRRAIRYRL